MNYTITHEYLDLQEKYEKIYGRRTIVLMEVGSFFEIYGVENDKIKKGLVKEIATILNIQVARKSKNTLKITHKNPYMAGFPNWAKDKYLPILLKEGYTVVLVEQVTKPPKPKRAVTKIISPSTNLDYDSVTNDTNFTVFLNNLI